MNRYFAFRRIVLACSLIVAVGASTAHAQFYDPLGVQNKSKPFGQYGPTFQYTSPTKFMNAVNGRSNFPPSGRVAQRVSPSRSILLEDLNLSFVMPSGSWGQLEKKETGSSIRYMLTQQNPKIVISLSGERASGGSQPTNATLLAESQAKMKSLNGTVEPGEQQVSAGDIDGLAYAATVVGDKQTTYYAMWVAAYNGYNYKLAVYGDKHDEPAIDAAMSKFVHGIKPLHSNHVAYRNNRNKSTTR